MNTSKLLPGCITAIFLIELLASVCIAAPLRVQGKNKPTDKNWKEHPAWTVEDLGALTPEPALDRFGGRMDRSSNETGFFYSRKIGDRWWFVDPDGRLWLSAGVTTVTPRKPSPEWAQSATTRPGRRSSTACATSTSTSTALQTTWTQSTHNF